jgi:hypothetical protein
MVISDPSAKSFGNVGLVLPPVWFSRPATSVWFSGSPACCTRFDG